MRHRHPGAHDRGHDHAGGHAHAHGHAHRPTGPDAGRRLRWALAITIAFLVAEVVGGWLSNSLALLADAGHMATDAGALGLSLFVSWFARQASNSRKTFGYLRLEILAAFVNGTSLLVISGFICWEAVSRLRAPEPTAGGLMLAVAVAGLVANLVAAWLLRPAPGDSLNVRGAYLHVLGDLLGSVGTVAAAAIIGLTGWLAADPIASLVTTLLIVRGAWSLVRESVDVLLEATPAHIDCDEVREVLLRLPGVQSVHDLHVWTVTSGVVAMSAHAVVPDEERHQEVLELAHAAMAPFGIGHITVQLERASLLHLERHQHA
ncbi:MAG: cation transporter [Gemmatimonadetes bacterium]|nr:cation transporter [Gemmatimonadota bacterium]